MQARWDLLACLSIAVNPRRTNTPRIWWTASWIKNSGKNKAAIAQYVAMVIALPLVNMNNPEFLFFCYQLHLQSKDWFKTSEEQRCACQIFFLPNAVWRLHFQKKSNKKTRTNKMQIYLHSHDVWRLAARRAENRDLTKHFLTFHLTLWQRLDRTPGRYTQGKTCGDRNCQSPQQIHPDAWCASVTSTNEKQSQQMLQSSGPSHPIDWLNAILPGPVKLGTACLGSRRHFRFLGLLLCLTLHRRRNNQPVSRNHVAAHRRPTLPNKTPRTAVCNSRSHRQRREHFVLLWSQIWGNDGLSSKPSCLAVASYMDHIFRSKS